MSPKIKLEINSKKSLEDLPNEKISISLNTKKANKQKKTDQLQIPNNKKSTEKKILKIVTLDQQLYKQFKNTSFQKVDLHGHTVDEAYQKVYSYLKSNFKKKNLSSHCDYGLGQ